ncbi:MAG: Fic family protein [Candidatus Woesearchaeota archaeon]
MAAAASTTLFPLSVSELESELNKEIQRDRYGMTLKKDKRIRSSIYSTSLKHSIQIEPDMGEIARNVKKDVWDQHKKAWGYAIDNISKNMAYDEKDLVVISKFLAPNINTSILTGFRKYDAQIVGSSHEPVDPSKISAEINYLIHSVQSFKSPLEKAIYSHYHLARIHPFEDGNGRTSRMVQDSLLWGAGYLSPAINVHQRDLYLEILNATDKQYKEGDKEYLHLFSQFIVEGIKENLDHYKKTIKIPKSKKKKSESAKSPYYEK